MRYSAYAALAGLTLAAVACAAERVPPADTTAAPTAVTATETAFVVARKAPPDTLFDSAGRFCVVRGAAKWEAADVGAVYPCIATDPDSSARLTSHPQS